MKSWLLRCIARDEDDPLTVHTYISLRKNKLYKNLILLSLSQSAMYLMYKLMMMIREYEHDFLGIWSYTMFNVANSFGALLLPPLVLSCLRVRNSLRYGLLLISLLIPILYMKRIETIIPVAIIIGLLGAVTRVAQLSYIYRLAKIMCKISGDDLQTILLRFSGIFFSIYKSYEIACYLPISFIPTPQKSSNDSRDLCGTKFNFGDFSSLSEFTLPPRNERSLVASLTLMVLGFCTLLLSIALIDSPARLTATRLGREDYSQSFATTFRLFKSRRLQLMIPMSLFAGYEKTIKSHVYTTAYVGCSESVPRVIYVHFLGCLAASQMSLSLGPLVELTSLQIMLSIAASAHLVSLLVLLLKSHVGVIGYYVMSAIWGLASSMWDSLLYVLYGILSPGEETEAYCHLGFWYSVGASISLIFVRLVSVSLELWTGFFFLLMATASATTLPYIINYSPKRVEPTNAASAPDKSGASGLTEQRAHELSRKIGVNFGRAAALRKYHTAEVKSINTSKIHHIAIPRTRPRFDRHDTSNEDIASSI